MGENFNYEFTDHWQTTRPASPRLIPNLIGRSGVTQERLDMNAPRSRLSRFLDHVAVWQANSEEARFIQQSI